MMDNMASAALDLRDIPLDRQRHLRREEYEKLVGLGIFEHERVELLYGVIVQMTPIGPSHCDAVDRLAELLILALSGRARVRIQGSFAASDDSEPEPDVAVYPLRDYSSGHPDSAHLIIEVAQSSLHEDRGTKAQLYAEAGVPEYWIVNLVDQVVELHRKPEGGKYTQVSTARKGESLQIESFPDVVFSVGRILPP
ncbi:MAG TPA: Uma2 family endonuclease [Polyangiaceae bacterium]|nr:Uma2 family endonuclease [Polyangiaceae bacterium]